MSLESTERAKYEMAWSHDEYRQVCHGSRIWSERPDLIPAKFQSVLDIGCGLGRLVNTMHGLGFDAWGVDIAANCLDEGVKGTFVQQCIWDMDLDRTFDVGICADVMEHIPGEKVRQSLIRIAVHCRQVVFKIAHEVNTFYGETLHLTLHPPSWWIDQMVAIGGSATFTGIMVRHKVIEDSLIVWSPGVVK